MTEEQRKEFKRLCDAADIPDKSDELLTRSGAQQMIKELRWKAAEQRACPGPTLPWLDATGAGCIWLNRLFNQPSRNGFLVDKGTAASRRSKDRVFVLPSELLIGRDCLVGEHQPPPLATAHHQLYRVSEKTAGHHRIAQLAGSFEIVPGDFNRTLYQERQRFCHLFVQPFMEERPAAISVPD
jgi:hypothetical protein